MACCGGERNMMRDKSMSLKLGYNIVSTNYLQCKGMTRCRCSHRHKLLVFAGCVSCRWLIWAEGERRQLFDGSLAVIFAKWYQGR